MDPNLAHPDVSLFPSKTTDLMDVSQISDVPKYHGMLARRTHELECELWALRCCHNAVTLTCRLPPEILARIFLDLASMGLSSWYAPNYRVSVSWLRVTFVCRHWRSVALQSPSLWSNIVFSNTNLAETMLTRSKGAPLTIWYNNVNNRDKPSSVLTTALSSVDRLRSVNLRVSPVHDDSYIQPALLAWAQKTGPALTSFEMSCMYNRNGSLPKAFLRASSHSLRILSIVGCDCTWEDLPIGPTITHLSLKPGKMFSSNTHRPTHSMLVYSLQQMPLLQRLNLSGFLPSEADTHYPEPIYIPSLRSLSLEDDARIIEVSLPILRIPRGARVDLKSRCFTETNNNAERVDQTLRGLRGFVPANRAFRKLLLRVDSQIISAPHFEFWFEEGADDTLERPCLTLSFHVHPMGSFPDYITLIRNHLGAPDTMSLHLKDYPRMPARALRTALGQIPQLNVVTFEAFPFGDIPKFLKSPAHLDGTYASSNEGGCFPGLTIINCVALDMGACKDDDFPEVIVRMLDGHTIREINFQSCINFRKKCFEMMKEKVPSVLFSCDRLQ